MNKTFVIFPLIYSIGNFNVFFKKFSPHHPNSCFIQTVVLSLDNSTCHMTKPLQHMYCSGMLSSVPPQMCLWSLEQASMSLYLMSPKLSKACYLHIFMLHFMVPGGISWFIGIPTSPVDCFHPFCFIGNFFVYTISAFFLIDIYFILVGLKPANLTVHFLKGQ